MIERSIIKYKDSDADETAKYIGKKILSRGHTYVCANMVQGLLDPDPSKRLSVEIALKSDWFKFSMDKIKTMKENKKQFGLNSPMKSRDNKEFTSPNAGDISGPSSRRGDMSYGRNLEG
jgi:serine/threonine protein kinase